MKEKTNLTMLCDFYELTMGNRYFQTGLGERITILTCSSARSLDQGGFAIAAGLAQVIEYIQKLRFGRGGHRPPSGLLPSSWTICAGSVSPATSGPYRKAPPSSLGTHPHRAGPAIQAQFIETFMLLEPEPPEASSLPSPTASFGRPRPSGGEFGSRRAQGRRPCAGRPRLLHRRLCRHRLHPWPTTVWFPATGTMAPPGCRCSPTSTPPSRPTASSIPNNATLLVDTYNVLRPACPTPSGPSKRCCSPGHHPVRHPAGQRRSDLSVPERPARCWTRPG